MYYDLKIEEHGLIRKVALFGVSMMAFALTSAAYANPEAGQVVGGEAGRARSSAGSIGAVSIFRSMNIRSFISRPAAPLH